ncbi:MAG TPA: hypothetical protein VHL80_14185 [Polyangia bacterium]|nr:hypothetical protein [Polyangia bacterium]HVZ75422.1 hypothetical protein [Polyangia bacterium]
MSDAAYRRASVVTGLGLSVELVAAVHWTPATFILAAAVGAPLVVLGGAMFLRAVWRVLKDRGAA